MTFVGSSSALHPAADRNVPLMVFVYDDGVVFARPTWTAMTVTKRDTAVHGSAADLAIALLSFAAPLNASGGALGRGPLLRLMRRVRRAHEEFRERAHVVPFRTLVDELAAAGWRAVALAADDVTGWSARAGTRRRPGQVDLHTGAGRRYSVGGPVAATEWLTALLGGRYPRLPGPPPAPPAPRAALHAPLVASVPPHRYARVVVAVAALAVVTGTMVGRYVVPAIPRGARMIVLLCDGSAAQAGPTCPGRVTSEQRNLVVDAARQYGATVSLIGDPDTSDVLVAVLGDPEGVWSSLQTRLEGMSGVAAVVPACDGGPPPTSRTRSGCVDPYAPPGWGHD